VPPPRRRLWAASHGQVDSPHVPGVRLTGCLEHSLLAQAGPAASPCQPQKPCGDFAHQDLTRGARNGRDRLTQKKNSRCKQRRRSASGAIRSPGRARRERGLGGSARGSLLGGVLEVRQRLAQRHGHAGGVAHHAAQRRAPDSDERGAGEAVPPLGDQLFVAGEAACPALHVQRGPRLRRARGRGAPVSESERSHPARAARKTSTVERSKGCRSPSSLSTSMCATSACAGPARSRTANTPTNLGLARARWAVYCTATRRAVRAAAGSMHT
jgi:hypothetical protein